MAVSHIPIDETTPHGRRLRRGLDLFEEGFNILKDETAAMPVMIDGSDHAHLEAQFGIPTGKGATAKAELESMTGKLSTNAQQTGVSDAIQQVLNLFA